MTTHGQENREELVIKVDIQWQIDVQVIMDDQRNNKRQPFNSNLKQKNFDSVHGRLWSCIFKHYRKLLLKFKKNKKDTAFDSYYFDVKIIVVTYIQNL